VLLCPHRAPTPTLRALPFNHVFVVKQNVDTLSVPRISRPPLRFSSRRFFSGVHSEPLGRQPLEGTFAPANWPRPRLRSAVKINFSCDAHLFLDSSNSFRAPSYLFMPLFSCNWAEGPIVQPCGPIRYPFADLPFFLLLRLYLTSPLFDSYH